MLYKLSKADLYGNFDSNINHYLSNISRVIQISTKKMDWHGKTNKVACAPSEDLDQSGHPPSLFKVFASAVGTDR